MPSDVVMSVRGFEPGDSAPSSFGGSPGIVDCDDAMVPLEPAGDALITGADVIVPPGALVLNATPFVVIPNESESITTIKARYP
jgi:hypothetical protein